MTLNKTHKVETLSFQGLGLSEKLLQILQQNKFVVPTPIQHQCIPPVLEGKDIVGIAQTGTGKTLAFGLPLLQRLAELKGRGLILLPTRELALQVDDVLRVIGGPLGLKTSILIGGSPMHKQIFSLRRNPHIIVATPGRLMDHLQQKNVDLRNIKMVVLDEADRMFDVGFMPQIEKILKMVTDQHQTLMFSATMPPAISNLAARFMRTPFRIEVAPAGTPAAKVEQEFFITSREVKPQLLDRVLSDNPGTTLVFSRTKHGAKRIARQVREMGHTAVEIHSNRTLAQRKEALEGFKAGRYRVLVATDIAARGIDVAGITLVVNYDLPSNTEDYVHRIGRTARAGHSGKAISFAAPEERGDLREIERLIKKSIVVKPLPVLPPRRVSTVEPRSDHNFGNFSRDNRPQQPQQQQHRRPLRKNDMFKKSFGQRRRAR